MEMSFEANYMKQNSGQTQTKTLQLIKFFIINNEQIVVTFPSGS